MNLIVEQILSMRTTYSALVSEMVRLAESGEAGEQVSTSSLHFGGALLSSGWWLGLQLRVG